DKGCPAAVSLVDGAVSPEKYREHIVHRGSSIRGNDRKGADESTWVPVFCDDSCGGIRNHDGFYWLRHSAYQSPMES
ncbi:MAG: hypothetical protein U1C33_09030, partial [Candidatus Cloacimonadaceae bacterium]|nr:hypothetical protein [Candidatus Cloacimonadaceae bacterium]